MHDMKTGHPTAATETAAVAEADIGAERRPLVVASVGTDHHRFDRLVQWLDRWAASHRDVDVVIQYGKATAPMHAVGKELLDHHTLCDMFSDATAVVSHGGPSTVMDARMAGRLPIVVGRDPGLGEHVDDHQLRFVAHLARHGMALTAATEDELVARLDQALAAPESVRLDRRESGVPPGVAAFATLADRLLGIGDS